MSKSLIYIFFVFKWVFFKFNNNNNSIKKQWLSPASHMHSSQKGSFFIHIELAIVEMYMYFRKKKQRRLFSHLNIEHKN